MVEQNSNRRSEGYKDGGVFQNLWPIPLQVWLLFQLSQSFFSPPPPTPPAPSPLKQKGSIFKKFCLGEISNFHLSVASMLRTWDRVLLGGINRNEKIRFFDSQMHFSVILTPWIWTISPVVLGYTGLRENSANIWRII